MNIQIKEFRFDDKPWRIDWLGKVIYPASTKGEPRIKVFLTELLANYTDPFSRMSVPESPRHKVVEIRIGQVAILKIGSVWIDGIEVISKAIPKEIECKIEHEKVRLAKFDCHVAIGDSSQPLFSPIRYRVGIDAFREISDSWVLLIDHPTSKINLLIIPSTVIFQKCFVTSPKAVRRLIYGQLEKLIDPDSWGFVEDDLSAFYINLFKDFHDSEGAALANLVADPIANREFKRLRKTLIVESANSFYGKSLTHLKVSLPFSNSVQIKARGKYLAFETIRNGVITKEWGFLATELTGLKTKLIFKSLIIDRKNNAKKGTNANDPNLPETWTNNNTTPIHPEDTTLITSNDDPDGNLDKLIFEVSGNFDAEDLEIIYHEKDVQKYRGRPKIDPTESEFNGTGTTGDSSSGTTGTAETDLAPTQTPNIPIDLDYFFDTLIILEKKGFSFRTIIVSKQFTKRTTDGGIVNFLPRLIKRVRNWHLCTDDESAPPRAYVVAEIMQNGVWHYLIELQRRKNVAIGLLHFRDHSGNRIDRERIEQFMIDAMRENGWSAQEFYRSWIFQSINHISKNGAESFASLIVRKLFKL